MAGPVLEINNLRVAYGSQEVLHGVTLSVAAGEVVGLIGPNGCGKTTIMRAVTGLVAPASGDVRWDGVSVVGLSAPDRARLIAVVPQNPVLPAGFTVREIVLMGRTAHLRFLQQERQEDFAKAEEALALVGAGDLAGRRVEELSGGERQRAVIARALAQEAPVLLLDEPTANLDLGHQIAVGSLIRELALRRGLAVLTAVHDLTLAALYCDRLVLMRRGTVLTGGAPALVLKRQNLLDAYAVDPVVVPLEGPRGPAVLPLTRSPALRALDAQSPDEE